MPLTFYPATDAQLRFIKSLSEDRDVPVAGKDADEAELIARWEDCFSGKDVTKQEASRVIDWLKALPKTVPAAKPQAAAAAPAAPLTEGVYACPDGSLVKVKANKAKTGHYALAMMDIHGQRLTMAGDVVKWDWIYAAGLIREIKPEWKLDAKTGYDLGIKYSRCLWCGRTLVASDSVLKGLGPVCAKKYFA